MQSQPSWYQNRIVIALLGAVLIGGLSAIYVIQQPRTPTSASTTHGPGGVPAATATPLPTMNVTIDGNVTNIDFSNQAFGLKPDTGPTLTVLTNNTTLFGGTLGSLNDLRTNLRVEVIGAQAANGTITATSVTSQQ